MDMAKTLFFIEALVFAALAIAFPIIAASAFIIPAVVSIALPIACAMAIWPHAEGNGDCGADSARDDLQGNGA
jgi:hypothetical protein